MSFNGMVMDVFKATSRSDKSGKWKNTLPTGRFENGIMVECSMKPSQRDIYPMKDEPYLILSQPPGGGKSTAIKFCHIEDIISNPERRLVIAVPLEGISKTFGDVKLNFDDGNSVRWSPKVNLCKPTIGSKVVSLMDFLTRKDFTQDYGERICICTHDLLEAVYKQLRNESEPKRLGLFSNLTIIVDEGHHVLNTNHAEGSVNNLLGNMIDFMLHNWKRIENSKVWFLTATYVRGDRLDILSEKNVALFKRHSLPLDKHWRENFRNIEDYSYGFVNYPSAKGPFDAIEKVLKNRKVPTIIYMPRRGSSQAKWCSNGCKMAYLKMVKESIHKVWPKAVILDLVDDNGREDRKQDILMIEEEIQKVDIILTVGMMDEGIDWPDAVQILDLAPSNSLRIAVQRFGRLLRDTDGKKHIYYLSFLQSSIGQILDPEGYKYQLNEAHAALTSSLLIEDMIQPVGVIPKATREKSDSGDESEFDNWFVIAVQDEGERAQILEDIVEALLKYKGKSGNKDHNFMGAKVAKKIIHGVLGEYGVEHIDKVARQIVAMLRRRTISYGRNMAWAVDAGFDELWDDGITDNLLGYVGKGCGITTFAKYREISLKYQEAIWEANVRFIKEFKATHNGQFPDKNSTDQKESYMAQWLDRQMKNKVFIAMAKKDGRL